MTKIGQEENLKDTKNDTPPAEVSNETLEEINNMELNEDSIVVLESE